MHTYPHARAIDYIRASGLNLDTSPAAALRDAIFWDVQMWARHVSDIGQVMAQGVPEYCPDAAAIECEAIADETLAALLS